MRKKPDRRKSTSSSRGFLFPAVAVLAAIAVLALGAYAMRGSWSTTESLPLETNNVKGSASAPVEIEEWSDFQ